MEFVSGEPPAPEPAPISFATELTDSLAKYAAMMDLPDVVMTLNYSDGGAPGVVLRLSIDQSGVTLNVSEGFPDADALALFVIRSLQTDRHIRDAANAMTGPEMIAIYDAMKSEDVLANVEPGDHGNAILEAYGRRVIAAALAKVGGPA